jgi:acyl-CoA synthetase (AMP-forming)/AMP-acid ligase II
MQAFAGFAIFDIAIGMCAVLPRMDMTRPATANPADVLAAIQYNRTEVAFASPIVWQRLTRFAIEDQQTCPSLQVTLTVGAPIPADLHHRFRKILAPGRQVFTPYGATEAMPVSSIGTDEVLEHTWARTRSGHGTCVGKPIPGMEVRIIRITDEPIPAWADALRLPDGEVGEVVVSGPGTSPAYKDAPQANVKGKIREGERIFHRMGDLGYVDEQGRLWFCGRKAHRLTTSAGLLPSVMVEGIYNDHPSVFRTALVGLGAEGRQLAVLAVEMEAGQAFTPRVEAELRNLARGTRWEGRVSRFLVHPCFPTDARHNSKIRREDLRSWAALRCRDLLEEVA